MWVLVVMFVALQSPPPGHLVANGFLTVGECHAAGEAKQEEVRQRFNGRLIAHFECLQGI
jgi:hypothetical protein